MVFQFFLPRRAEVSREGQFCSPRRAEDSREGRFRFPRHAEDSREGRFRFPRRAEDSRVGQFRFPRRAEDFPAILAVRLPVNFWLSDPSSFDVFAGKVTNLFSITKQSGGKTWRSSSRWVSVH